MFYLNNTFLFTGILSITGFSFIYYWEKYNGKKIIITIDGNIGSGKSTLLYLLSRHPKFKNKYIFITVPVSVWNTFIDNNGNTILTKFYNDKKKWSYLFQNMALITRYISIKNNRNNNIITERSIYTDKNVFANLLYNENFIDKIEMDVYNYWFTNFKINIDLFIYLNTNVENCQKRILKRNRTGENAIDKDYLISLEKSHLNWLSNHPNLLFINGNVDFINDTTEFENIISQISSKIKCIKKKNSFSIF